MVEDEMDAAVNQAVEEARANTPSLLDQARVLARASTEIRDRARRDQLRIMADYRERVTAIDNDHERACSEALAELDRKHKQALDQAEDHMRAELDEHALLTIRLGRLG